mgnify:CR=1 FL=1
MDGGLLPPFSAGAHVDLQLADRLVRSYSLINSQDERHRYRIAVSKSPSSKGGSRHMHERLRPGDVIDIGAPRNNFPLHEAAAHSVLIAGGIGITPILGMIGRLERLGRSWKLYYCARTRRDAAFLETLEAFEAAAPGRVFLNFDHEPGGSVLDLGSIIAGGGPGTHFYCCGPAAMLEAFRSAASAASVEPERVHFEYFAPPEPIVASGGFTVVLARSGLSLPVPPGRSILEVVLEAGIEVANSCREGICGSCETPVLDGIPDHRDYVLSQREHEANRSMMICCSGSRSEKLTLDL